MFCAIKSIAITTPGKYKCLNHDAIGHLIPLIHDPLSEMRVNALKIITCLSEAPEGRKELLKHVDNVIIFCFCFTFYFQNNIYIYFSIISFTKFLKIRKLESDQVPIVSKHAIIAVKIITWKP